MPHNLETEPVNVLEAQARLLERRKVDQAFKQNALQNPLQFMKDARALGFNSTPEAVSEIMVQLAPRTRPIALEVDDDQTETSFRTENIKPRATVSRGVYGKVDITIDQFEQAFNTAERLALEQYSPFAEVLGKRLFSLAVTIRTVCLMSNPKAKPTATLCGVMPFNVLAALEDVSREYLYRQIKGNDTFKWLIGGEQWASDFWIGAGSDSDGQEAKAFRASGGTMFVSRAAPLEGSTPKPRAFDWKRPWRDMAADVRDGRTAKQIIAEIKKTESHTPEDPSSHTYTKKELRFKIQMLKHFFYLSLPMFNIKRSVNNVCEPSQFEAVSDALDTPIPTRGKGRAAWCEQLAKAISHALNDSHSVEGWMAAAWTVAKCLVYQVGPAREILLGAVYDVMVRLNNGQKVLKAGGLARHLMNLNGWKDLEAATADLNLGRAKSER